LLIIHSFPTRRSSELNQIIQTTQICHPVAPSGRKSVSENLVVPKIHVQGKLIVNTLHIESCHVTDNTLQGSVNLHFAHEQVRIYLTRISGLLILVVFRLALYSENLAAFVRIIISHVNACIQTDLGI